MASSNKKVTVQFDTVANTTGANQATAAVDKVTKTVTASKVSMQGMGQVSTSASYQLQDFAVQVGMGTSAVKAFSQQAPQFLSTLAAAGVVTGPVALGLSAIAVAIPLITLAMKSMGGETESAADAAEKAATQLKALSEKASKADFSKLEQAATAMEDAAAATEAMKNDFPLTKKASEDFAISAIGNAEKLVIANNNIAAAMGLQVDAVLELEAAEERAAEKRRALAQQKIEEEQARLKAAEDEVARNQQKVADLEAQIAQWEASLAEKKARYAANLELQDRSKAAIANRMSVSGFGGEFGEVPTAAMDPEAYVASQDAANTAEKLLPKIESAIEQQRKDIGKLADGIDDLGSELERSKTRLTAVTNKAIDTKSAIETNIASLEASLNVDNYVAKSQLLVAKQKEVSAKIDETVKQVSTTTDAGKAAVAGLSAITANHQVTVDETLKANSDLRTVAALLASGLEKSNQSGITTLQTVNTLMMEITKLNAAVKAQNAQAVQNSTSGRSQ